MCIRDSHNIWNREAYSVVTEFIQSEMGKVDFLVGSVGSGAVSYTHLTLPTSDLV